MQDPPISIYVPLNEFDRICKTDKNLAADRIYMQIETLEDDLSHNSSSLLSFNGTVLSLHQSA